MSAETNSRRAAVVMTALLGVALVALAWFIAAALWGLYAGFAAGRSGENTDWYVWWVFAHVTLAMFTTVGVAWLASEVATS